MKKINIELTNDNVEFILDVLKAEHSKALEFKYNHAHEKNAVKELNKKINDLEHIFYTIRESWEKSQEA